MQLNYIIDTCNNGYRYDIESDTFIPDEEDIKLDRKIRIWRLSRRASDFCDKHGKEIMEAIGEYHRRIAIGLYMNELKKRGSGK